MVHDHHLIIRAPLAAQCDTVVPRSVPLAFGALAPCVDLRCGEREFALSAVKESSEHRPGRQAGSEARVRGSDQPSDEQLLLLLLQYFYILVCT